MGERTELLQGTLDLLILKALALEPMHGWAVSQRLRQISDGVLSVQQGSLYPALQRLELQGWILSEWRLTEGNRRARFYTLTRNGRRRLEKETADWQRFTAAVQQVLSTT
jgi:PadR family transcriptional regulator PadR